MDRVERDSHMNPFACRYGMQERALHQADVVKLPSFPSTPPRGKSAGLICGSTVISAK